MAEWNQILSEEWYHKEEPEQIVVDFVTLLRRMNRKMRVLDLGCGAGRHQVYVTKEGFEAHGIDTSETGLNLTKERLKKQKSEVCLVKGDMKMLPYVDSCFDAIMCIHTIYHQKLDEIRRTVSEISRVLRRKSYVLINFLSKRTYSYGKGVQVEEGTFIEQEGIEKDVPHHFTDEEEIKHLFKNFEMLDLKHVEREIEGKLRSRWILIAKT